MTDASDTTESSHGRYINVAIFLLVVVGASFAWQQFTGVYHLAVVQPGVLYRDGARSAREFKTAVGKIQPKTVVCLVEDREVNDPAKPQFKQEFEFLKQVGIRCERIPVKLGGWPKTDDIRRFLDIASAQANQPVLVHCAQGVRRTAMMVAAYQESVLGYDKERAKAEILTFGHSEKTIDDIRKFIDAYDPQTRTAPAELAQAK